MDGCIYRTKDGECDLYSEGGKFHSVCCDMNSCDGRKMSNADRIRAMTDEELAEFIKDMEVQGYDLHGTFGTEYWLDWLRAAAWW